MISCLKNNSSGTFFTFFNLIVMIFLCGCSSIQLSGTGCENYIFFLIKSENKNREIQVCIPDKLQHEVTGDIFNYISFNYKDRPYLSITKNGNVVIKDYGITIKVSDIGVFINGKNMGDKSSAFVDKNHSVILDAFVADDYM